MLRTHTCGQLTKVDTEKKVTLTGWINKRRDLGSMIFIDLRDRYGMTQLVFDTKVSLQAYEDAKTLRNEWVILIEGKVSKREKTNPNLKTGEIEILVDNVKVLSKSKNLPFSIFEDKTETNEELRLKYRYLDLRRKPIFDKILMRHIAMLEVRNFLSENDFLEVNTPILCKSTPEGARDYLVPSRIYPGNFYALPQSPQLFKQLLMIGGVDRYFQLANCFRDEDPRADRQPEFTQIDIEMSFGSQEDIFEISENLVKSLFKKCLNIEISTPFIKMSHKECLENYGTDKPDLRFDMKLIRIDDIAKKSSFEKFIQVLSNQGCIKAINIKNGSDLSRKKIEEHISFVRPFGIDTLFSIKKKDNTLISGLTKFFSVDDLLLLEKKLNIEENDLVLIAADTEPKVNQALDHLRRKLAKERNLIKNTSFKFLWAIDFPLLEYDDEDKRYVSKHHPFTRPKLEDLGLLDKDPSKVRAEAYDLVLNGYEIAGGSMRIYDSELQEKIFEKLNLSKEEIKQKFGFFIDALSFGTPPHGGIAYGFDRLIMLLTNTENMRDVIAFPKTLKGLDLMMQSPSHADPKQLKELKINNKEDTNINWT